MIRGFVDLPSTHGPITVTASHILAVTEDHSHPPHVFSVVHLTGGHSFELRCTREQVLATIEHIDDEEPF